MKRLLGVVAMTAAMLALAPSMPPATAALPTPYVVASAEIAAPGTVLGIRGAHWPGLTYLHAVLCGQNAIDGSADCALDAAITVTPGPDGEVQGSMEVVLPPSPCPCVVFVTDRSSTFSTRIPIDIVGAPTRPVVSRAPAPDRPRLEVETRVVGGHNLWSILGGPARRNLRISMRNTGEVPINPVISARWGRGERRHRILNAPAEELLLPGMSRSVDLDWNIAGLTYGSYAVAGEVAGAGTPVRFTAQTTTWPWLLLFLIPQALLLLARRVVRHRLAHHERRRRRAGRRLEREQARAEPERTPETVLIDR